MFDGKPNHSLFGNERKTSRQPEVYLDGASLSALLSSLSDEEIEEIEDDLDFAHFSGGLTPRLAALIEKIETLSGRHAA